MSSKPVHPFKEIEIAIQRLPNGGGLPLPAYASDGAAGMDIVAAETLTLRPGTRHAVATGFAMAIPPGYEVQVRPRSGLALKHGITPRYMRMLFEAEDTSFSEFVLRQRL